jgi:hypothetical protein
VVLVVLRIVKPIVWMVAITTQSPFRKFPVGPSATPIGKNLNFFKTPEMPNPIAFQGFLLQANSGKWLKPCVHAENLLYNRIAHLVNHQGKPP